MMKILFAFTTLATLMAMAYPTDCRAQYVNSGKPCWVYNTFQSWYQSNDTVYGKQSDMWTIYHIPNLTITVNGREYKPVISEPLMYITRQRSQKMSASDRWYTIGLRREGGRVYADYEEYHNYLNYRHTHGQPYNYMYSFGNPDYFPYRITENGEVLLYDYTLEQGEVYARTETGDDITVSDVSLVTLADGQQHRRLTLSNGLVLVEGLGCINSTGMLLDYLNPDTVREHFFTYLLWHKSNDNNMDYISDLNVQALLTGMNPSLAPGTTSTVFYSVDGMCLPAARHGFNIIRTKEGKAQKVVVK